MDALRIGFVGGGNMASALIAGLTSKGAIRPDSIRCSDASERCRDDLAARFGIETTASNSDLVAWAECVVVAVKPQVVERALAGTQAAFAGGKLLVSVCAGVSTERLETLAGDGVRVIRAMPNTPALVGQGATALARGRFTLDTDERFATQLFESVGKCWVVSESQLDAVTGLSGSGPGFVMLFLEALADGGVRSGLPRDVAMKLAVQTVLGSAALAASSDSHPAQLKDRVTSPAGTTIEGIAALERGGFRHAVIDAVCSAAARSSALGKRD